MQLDPAPDNPFDIGHSKAALKLIPVAYGGDVFFTYSRVPRIAVVEAESGTAPQVRVHVGLDSNGDGVPQPSELLCEAQADAGQTARCVTDLAQALSASPQATQAWVLIDVPQGLPNTAYAVTLDTAVLHVEVATLMGHSTNQYQTVTGPGQIPAETPFSLRFSWHDPYLQRQGQRSFGAIFVDPEPVLDVSASLGLTLGQAEIIPFALTRTDSTDDVVLIGASDARNDMLIRKNQLLRHAFVDVPPNAATLRIEAGSASPFFLIRADFPQPTSTTEIAAAPPSGAMFRSALVPGGGQRVLIDNGLEPGRWYIVMSSDGVAEENYASFATYLTYAGDAPTLAPGAYFNPARPGHGIFVSQASGQQLVDWYTYLEDGTPTWYIAQNIAPAVGASSWTSPLYRVTWHGDGTSYDQIGFVVLTSTGTNTLIFSWNLEGTYGSEPFQLLATGSCVSVGSTHAALSGMWFPPAQSGYGFDVVATPDFQFFALYIYDRLGVPRWAVGQSGTFATQTALPMLQSLGFCPSCAFTQLTSTTIGSMVVSYADGVSGHLSSYFQFNAPLGGTWTVDQQIAKLTGPATCAD